MKNIRIFYLKVFIFFFFFVVKYSVYLNRRVFVMFPQSVSDGQCLTINICDRTQCGPVCGFLVFWLQIAIVSSPNVCVSLWWFKDEVKDVPMRTEHVCKLELKLGWDFTRIQLPLPTQLVFHCCSSSLCVGGFMRGICFYYLFLICSSVAPREGCASCLWYLLDIFTYIWTCSRQNLQYVWQAILLLIL